MKIKIPFKKPKVKWNHVTEGLIIAGILATVVGVGVYFRGFAKFGLNSYNGLSPRQIRKVYEEFLDRYPPISKVGGHGLGGYFERGIAGNGGVIYYFHYNDNGDGKVAFSIYPEGFEAWTTDKGILGVGKWLTGKAIYP